MESVIREYENNQDIRETLMTLPEIKEIQEIEKRYAGVPDISQLKDQQIIAHDEMVQYLRDPGTGMYLLNGYAGTGKTFTIGKVIEGRLQEQRTSKIAMTAPTNKAVRVLYKAADFVHTNLTYKTIHSLLGLIEQIDNHGKQIFVQDKRKPPSIEEYGTLVVDETSMLNDDLFAGNLMMSGIAEYVRQGLKVIFMGDPAQIPPVNKPDAMPFDATAQKQYGIRVGTLTDVVRQALDNPILATTLAIRKALHRPVTFPSPMTQINDRGQGVVFFRQGLKSDSQLVEDILGKYFCSNNFEADADFMKVIAWRNKTVDFMNTFIRGMRYGEVQQKERIVIGEKLIADKPIFDGPIILFNTNDELLVKSYTIDTERINGGSAVGGFDIDFYNTKVSTIHPEGYEVEGIIKIVHNDSMPIYQQICDALQAKAKSMKQGTWEAGKVWKDWYAFKENFAEVKYNYAITAHKAQGSTYDNCLVLAKDIDNNGNVYERNRIKYTACSRPKTLEFVVV